ncbi:MAG: cupin domain-containing protein [Gammaproteobacteria bacterium]
MAERPQAQATVQVDDARVIVSEYRFAPGAQTGWHRHAHDYVVVPQSTGQLLIETHEGEMRSELTAGVAYSRPAGVEHNVINDNDFEFVFVEVEIKR